MALLKLILPYLPCPTHPLATSAWKTAAEAENQGQGRRRCEHGGRVQPLRAGPLQARKLRQTAARSAHRVGLAFVFGAPRGEPRTSPLPGLRVLPTSGRPRWEHLLLTALTLPSTAASRMRWPLISTTCGGAKRHAAVEDTRRRTLVQLGSSKKRWCPLQATAAHVSSLPPLPSCCSMWVQEPARHPHLLAAGLRQLKVLHAGAGPGSLHKGRL